MTKQVINVGTTANDKKGDSLRAAFQKVNANFTELYTALGLAADVNLNLGNFVFTDNTLSLTNSNGDDSTATQIEITQPVRIESNLTVGGDILPNGNLTSNLGSSSQKFHSIYVGTGSVYLGDARLSLEGGRISSSVGFDLTDSVGVVNGTVGWSDVTSKPSMFDIGGNVIGIASSDTITEETVDGTISQTTTIESQIEVAAENIVIAKRITQVVDDGVVVSTDATGSQFEVNNSSISIKRYVEPDGPNNSSYFQVGASNSGAILEGVEENVSSNTFGRITVTQGVISITASVEGNDKEWVFDFNGDVYVPTGSAIRGANDLSLVSSADGNSGVFVNGNSNVGTAVLYATNNAIITADYDGNRKDWNFDKSGTITVPLLLPKTFTAVLDEEHMVDPVTLAAEPWQYGVAFAVNPDGSVQTQMDDPTYPVDPGYSQGSVFRFTEADHGIPGYTFDITLNFTFDEQTQLFVTNPSVTPPPEYPSTIESTGAIKLTADTSNFVFGTDGDLTLPGGATLSSDAVNGFTISQLSLDEETTLSLNFGRGGHITVPLSIQFNLLDAPIGAVNSQPDSLVIAGNPDKSIVVAPNDGANGTWTFGTDGGLTSPSVGYIKQNNSYTKTVNSNSVSAGAGTVVWTSVVDYISSAKLVIQVECNEAGDDTGWHSQSCEAIIACRGYANGFGGPGGDPAITVYGVTYTSVAPLVTFTAQRNPTTKNVELVGTLTGTASGTASIKIHSVEMSTRD